MKIQDRLGKHPPFDVASGLAESLLASGDYVAFQPPAVPARIPNTKWSVQRGLSLTDSYLEPCISYSCSSCGDRGIFTGPTAERSQVVRHCGVSEQPPPEIQAEYRKLRKAWDGGMKKKVPLTLRERAEALKSSAVRTV